MPNPTQEVLSYIIDDSALLALALKKKTRDGIRRWVNAGAIRLFVPLHTLEQLKHADAREALRWLDEVTSEPTAAIHLQESDQEYDTWEEVEKYLLPETLLSIEDEEEESYRLSAEFERSLMLDGAPDDSDYASLSSSQSLEHRPMTPSSPRSLSSATSPGNALGSHKQPFRGACALDSPERVARNSTKSKRASQTRSATPPSLRPLFNHSLWLINQEPASEAVMPSFILLTEERSKQRVAQKFGIKTKTLKKLGEQIEKEDRDNENRSQRFKTEKALYVPPPATLSKNTSPRRTKKPKSDDEDVVVFKRNSRGSNTSNNQKVLDPNEFSRTPPRNNTRGGARGGRGTPRGGARAGYHAPPPERSSPRAVHDPAEPIDPDSYTRPPPARRSMRGGGGKLWEPS